MHLEKVRLLDMCPWGDLGTPPFLSFCFLDTMRCEHLSLSHVPILGFAKDPKAAGQTTPPPQYRIPPGHACSTPATMISLLSGARDESQRTPGVAAEMTGLSWAGYRPQQGQGNISQMGMSGVWNSSCPSDLQTVS